MTDEVTRQCTTLSYLVHSAGVVKGRRELTLLPLLERSASETRRSRIVIISGAAKNRTIHFDDVNLTRRFVPS